MHWSHDPHRSTLITSCKPWWHSRRVNRLLENYHLLLLLPSALRSVTCERQTSLGPTSPLSSHRGSENVKLHCESFVNVKKTNGSCSCSVWDVGRKLAQLSMIGQRFFELQAAEGKARVEKAHLKINVWTTQSRLSRFWQGFPPTCHSTESSPLLLL